MMPAFCRPAMEERRGPLSGGDRLGMDPENRIGWRAVAVAFPVLRVFLGPVAEFTRLARPAEWHREPAGRFGGDGVARRPCHRYTFTLGLRNPVRGGARMGAAGT